MKDVTPFLNGRRWAFCIFFRAHVLKLRCFSCGTVKKNMPSWKIVVSFQQRQNQVYSEVIRGFGILIFWLLLIIKSKSPDVGYKQVAPAKTIPHRGVFSSLPACHAVALAAEVATSWRGSRAHLRCKAGLTCAALPSFQPRASFPSPRRSGPLAFHLS